jgi:hypothetical protein
MPQRVFGPVRGAGVQVTELEGQRPIEPGARGVVGYVGILERGNPGELIVISSERQLAKKVGGIISDSILPDACQDYWSLAQGAGGMLLVRVTDGTEVKASAPLYARQAGRTVVGTVRAKNGGRWGGKDAVYSGVLADDGDVTNIALTTAVPMGKDQWKGGYVELAGAPNKRYPVTGNTTAGVVSVASDQTMAVDLAAGDPANLRYYLVLERESRGLSIEIRDGEEDPANEFGLYVYLDGDLVNPYPNLSMSPTSRRYWVDVINKDGNNDEIEVVDSFTGARTANIRPSGGGWGVVSAVDATTMTAKIHELIVQTSPTGANPTVALGTTTDAMRAQVITITMTSATAFTAVSDKFGALGTVGSGTLAVLYTPNNKWTPPFTITNGGTVLATGDVLKLHYMPFEANALVGGYLFPDRVNAKRTKYRIVSNTHKIVTVADGSLMTDVSTANDEFMIQAQINLSGGRDGNAGVTDTHYTAAWSVDSSPFNRVAGKGFGLIKFATPGITSSAVQKACQTYAAAKNFQHREEIPANIVTEDAADTFVNDTVGRSDYSVVSFPSFGYVNDPASVDEVKLKLVSLTGMIHGREARIANDYDGYHKAEAGVDATLPRIVELTTGDNVLNEEQLNPRGINVIKKRKGQFIMWGDRTLWTSSEWKFKHQREQMSHYEHDLMAAYDYIMFELNQLGTREKARASLNGYFHPEWKKGALDQDFKFTDACSIKIDRENNTPAVKAQGDMMADIYLRLTDTVERFRIRIGKMGIFEAVV